ncbi:uncharacterized protein [Amphiura filiformis]|uniref:uncharacterized protein isoform X2 n=1 Tax=Amphiura filiformis TaxID=82378 RepID=UPI003B22238B
MGRPVEEFTCFILTQIVACLIWSSLIGSVPYTTVSMTQPANGVLNSLDPKETGLEEGNTSFPTETINQCENAHSCTHGCPSQPTACQCDELCHLFDDCCRNVSCNNDVTSIPEFDQLGITLDQIGCIKPVIPGTMTNLYNGIFMVDKCDDFASPLAKNCHTPNETDVQSFVPIATLMGFTWIFAFLAAFSGISALWYIYIIINSLQGLYIFFAFTFKRNIGRLWLKKFGLSKSMESRDDKSSNKKATRSTNVNSSQIQLIQRENMQREAKM